MNQHVMLHIAPDTRITWKAADGTFWVDVEETDGAAANGARLTIFAPDQETAIRLVSVLLTIRARITRKRDEVVVKLMKQGASA